MVLLVDDDPKFLEAAQAELRFPKGLFLAAHAEQAKSLMSMIGASISTVIIDLDLPGQDGFSLIGEIHHHFPDMAIIAISGVMQDHVLESAMLLGAVAALKKPITPEWQIALSRAREAHA